MTPCADPAQFAYTALPDGHTIEETVEALAVMPGVEKPQSLIEQARKRFRTAAREDEEAVVGWCLASARDLARKMQSIGDYAGALKAIQLIHKIATSRNDDLDS